MMTMTLETMTHDHTLPPVEEAHTAELAELSPELLNLIADSLSTDVLQPRHLGSLAGTCKVINVAAKDALDKLKAWHLDKAASELVVKCGWTVEDFVWQPKALYWSRKDLVAADAPALFNVLKSKAAEQVEYLDLFKNKIGEEGAAAIAAAAAKGGMPRLSDMSLFFNQIGDAGALALASGAVAGGAFRELKTLRLGRNKIGDAGVVALATAFETGALPALSSLFLGDNQIGDVGLKALSAAAENGALPTLQCLGLGDNGYGDEGGGNAYGEAGVEALAEAIEKGGLPSLRALCVGSEHMATPGRLKAVCIEKGVSLAD